MSDTPSPADRPSPGERSDTPSEPPSDEHRSSSDTNKGTPAEADEERASSPASRVKGLQKGEKAARRGLLASSGRLRDLLTSNRPLGVRNLLWAVLAVLLVITGLLAATDRIGTVARSLVRPFQSNQAAASEMEAPLEHVASVDDGKFTLSELPSHPDKVFQPYFAGQMIQADSSGDKPSLVSQFRDIVHVYTARMGEDDNFTLRAIDSRDYELLEKYTFEDERAAYEEAGEPADYNWERINRLRRQKTRQLVDKYTARGIPRAPIWIKWGRANQTRAARRRDRPFIEYEIRLARFLGLSLLTTEIGTVETFNHDSWVSPVGAKSRYQLMPSLLQKYGLHTYGLQAAAGNTVRVSEEQHPLLAMEPAYKHVAGSANASGNEITGISAYHTGMGNIYSVLRRFLTSAPDRVSNDATVMDAYMWAITEGFDTVSRGTSFGDFSRQYVISAYGALKAVEDVPIDTSRTMLADRVQLKDGESIRLNELLDALPKQQAAALDWSAPDSLSLYNRFRVLNKHFDLPEGPNRDTLTVGVPERGNVRLTATSQGEAVRFFLPPGARRLLAEAGRDVIDERKVFPFNHDTYPDPAGRRTEWDRRYAVLIDQIRRFGFTQHNKKELDRLTDRFEALAERNPTHYRQAMLDVIQKHRQFWRYGAWDKLAQAARVALGREPAKPQPLKVLPTHSSPLPPNVQSR